MTAPQMFRELPNPLYLVTSDDYRESYLGRVYDNKFIALKVCEPGQIVVELHLGGIAMPQLQPT